MTLTVLFFASLREALGERKLRVSVDPATTLRDLAELLKKDYDVSLAGALCAVNEHYAEPTQVLQEGDTVAFFPPVSGG